VICDLVIWFAGDADMTPEELRQRSRRFAERIVKLYRALPKSPEAQVLGKKLFKSGHIGGGELQVGMPVEIAVRIRLPHGGRHGGGRRELVLVGHDQSIWNHSEEKVDKLARGGQ